MAKKQIVASSVKSLTPLVLKNKDGLTKSANILFASNTNTAIIPFVKTRPGLLKSLELLFGTNGVIRYCERYFVPKKYLFDDRLGAKNKFLETTNLNDVRDEITHYRNLKLRPSFSVRDDKNCVFDYTNIISKALPSGESSFWTHPKVLANTETILLELFTKLVLGNLPNDINDKSIFGDKLKIAGSGNHDRHENVFIPIPFEVSSQKFLEYIIPEKTIPRVLRSSSETIFMLTIIRLIIALYTNDELSEPYNKFINLYEKKNIGFLFYTPKGAAFIIDLAELKNRDVSQKTFFQFLKTRLRYLIGINDGTEVIEEPEPKTVEVKETVEVRVTKLVQSRAKSRGLTDIITKASPGVVDIPNNHNLIDDFANSEDESNEIPLEVDEIESKDEIIENTEDLIEVIAKDVKPKVSAARLRRNEVNKDKYKSIQVDGRSVEEILNDVETLSIDNNPSKVDIKDKSLTHSNLVDFEKSYIEKTFERDMLQIVRSFGENKEININLIDIKKIDTSDALTEKYNYVFTFEDELGKRHTVNVDIPKIDKDGFLKLNGNKKILKKQLVSLPVTKIKPDLVHITSNDNKAMLFRQGKTLNREFLVTKKIIEKYLVDNNKVRISYGRNSKLNGDVLTTIDYDELSDVLHHLVLGRGSHRVEFFFNQKELRDQIKKDIPKYKFKAENMPFGIDYRTLEVIDISINDKTNTVCQYLLNAISELDLVKDLEKIISSMTIPKRRVYSRLMFQSKEVPLIIFLSSLYGITEIINKEKIKVHFTEKREKEREDEQVYIRFADGYLYYSEYPLAGAFLLNGLSEMHTESINFSDLDEISPYVDWLFDHFKKRNLLKGWKGAKEMFLDSITLEILRDLELPTDFLELFLYANSLLADNKYMSETDIRGYRVRGYEIINVCLYRALSDQYKLFKQKSPQAQTISIPPDEIMARLHKSFVLENYDATNPTNELKTKSIVTFKGPMGLNDKRAYTLEKRGYHDSFRGVIALSSVDSDQVGVVKQLSLDANIISTRGYIKPCESNKDAKKLTLGQLASPEEADLAFVNEVDDPKRIGFASGQTKHIIGVKESTYPLVSTGFDQSSPYFVGDMFVPKAKGDGKVISISDNGTVVVKYKDGTSELFETGIKLNRNSSFYLANPLKLNVKVGQTIKKGDIVAYNQDFYKEDINGNIRASQGPIARIVLHEGYYTDEDSSLLTSSFADKLRTDICKRKQITIPASGNIIRYRSVGDHVTFGDPLITFEDSGSDDSTSLMLAQLGDVDEETLDKLVRKMPKSNETGEIIDFKVYWSVPVEEMSESCQNLVKAYMKGIRKKIKLAKENGVDTRSLDNLLKVTIPSKGRINGAIIPPDGGVLIEYFILHENKMGATGDKLSFYSSLKSIVSETVPQEFSPYTEDGEPIDAVMGAISAQARMVNSIYKGGFIGTILFDGGINIAREFFDE